MSLEINIINKSNNPLPHYATAQSAGVDLYAFTDEEITLEPLERSLISTGIFIELPIGFEAQIRPRSGLAFKNGVTVLNSPGTIDADYRGELKVLLVNISNQKFVIKSGERIAQMVISKHETVTWKLKEILTETERAAGGFGSTGL